MVAPIGTGTRPAQRKSAHAYENPYGTLWFPRAIRDGQSSSLITTSFGWTTFANHIGISMIGIEQHDAVLKRLTFRLDLRQLSLALVEQAEIFAPCQEAGWTGNGQPAHYKQRCQRSMLRGFRLANGRHGIGAPHKPTESQLTSSRKPILAGCNSST